MSGQKRPLLEGMFELSKTWISRSQLGRDVREELSRRQHEGTSVSNELCYLVSNMAPKDLHLLVLMALWSPS